MSLNVEYDPNNIFAKILRGEVPSVKIADHHGCYSFMDAFPQSHGHCLVIPKKAKATNFFTIAPDDLKKLIVETQRIAKAVKAALMPDGIRILQFNGAPSGQTVYHIHFHIIPIYKGVELGHHATGGPAPTEKLAPIAEQIRAAL